MDTEIFPAVIWFLIGLFCVISEFFIPGLIIIFFGVGAWAVAFFAAFTDIGIIPQLIIFLITSNASLFLLRKRFMKKDTSSIDVTDDFIEKTAVAQVSFSKGEFGKVSFKGTSWRAQTDSDEIIKQGEYVRIVGRESIILKVEPITEKEAEL